jgi:hypothetical protein
MLFNISKTIWVIVLLSIALAITACGGRAGGQDIEPVSSIEAQSAPEEAGPTDKPAPSPRPTDIPTPLPTPTELPTEITEPVSPLEKPKEPTMATTSGEVQPLPGSDKALAAAMADLAKQTGLLSNDIQLVSMEATEWNDASLGCPQEGFMYAQVITPGFLIILEGQGQQYEYHTDRAGNVVLCKP